MTFIVHGPVWLFLADQVLPEFRATFVDGDSMAYYARTTSGSVREFVALHPCVLEGRNAVHGIKQPQKSYCSNWAAERFTKRAHEFEELGLFRLLTVLAVRLLVFWKSTLPLLKCP